MKNSLVILGLILSSSLIGQVNKAHEIRTYSGEHYTGERLSFETPILKSPYFQLDSLHFAVSEVAFFKNNHGYFANLEKLRSTKEPNFAMRIRKGNINLYEKVDFRPYAGSQIDLSDEKGAEEIALATGQHFDFYNKGEGDVKKSAYKNLHIDLADNPDAMLYLKKYRRYQGLQILALTAGAAMIASEIIRQEPREMQVTPVMVLGTLVAGCTLLIEIPKKDLKWMAVESYNR